MLFSWTLSFSNCCFLPVDSHLLDSRISSKHCRDTKLDNSFDFKASCEICKKKFRSSATLQAHFISPRHLWRLERFMMTSVNGHSTDTEGEPMLVESASEIDRKGMKILYFAIVISKKELLLKESTKTRVLCCRLFLCL